MRAADTLGRITLLVLSGTATLSLIGAIAETANTGPAVAPSIERAAAPDPGSVIDMPARPDQPGRMAAADAPEPAPPDPDRWLRALTYAVTALAGFAAAGVIVLLRIASALSRIAER